jgi:hypothetical protein
LGDTLDVKTSVILAVIVFLAAQSDNFFHGALNRGDSICSIFPL